MRHFVSSVYRKKELVPLASQAVYDRDYLAVSSTDFSLLDVRPHPITGAAIVMRCAQTRTESRIEMPSAPCPMTRRSA